MESHSLAEYIEEMRVRYPGLSKRKMCLLAGVPDNLIYKISEGLTPRPATLQKLAFEGAQEQRTEEERWEDYAELLRRAGYEVPETPYITSEEWGWIKRWRTLSPEQREMANAFFRAYTAGDTLEVLSQGLYNKLEKDSPVDDAFTRFLELLGEMAAISPAQRALLIAEALDRYRREHTLNGSRVERDQ